MTAPNIVQVASILGQTATQDLTTTNATVVLNNPASSNNVLKVNSITLANIDGSNEVTATVAINNQAAGAGSNVNIIQGATIPVAGSLVVTDKSIAFYLEEDRSIVATAGGANDVAVTVSYEIITD